MRFPTAGLRIFRAAKWGLSIVRAVRLPSCDFIDPETFGPNPVPAMKLRPLYVRERSLTSTGFKIRRGARNPESPSTTGTVGFFFFLSSFFRLPIQSEGPGARSGRLIEPPQEASALTSTPPKEKTHLATRHGQHDDPYASRLKPLVQDLPRQTTNVQKRGPPQAGCPTANPNDALQVVQVTPRVPPTLNANPGQRYHRPW